MDSDTGCALGASQGNLADTTGNFTDYVDRVDSNRYFCPHIVVVRLWIVVISAICHRLARD